MNKGIKTTKSIHDLKNMYFQTVERLSIKKTEGFLKEHK